MKTLTLAGGKKIHFEQPLVMGIVNCTPDSFAVRSETPENAIETARRIIEEGADVIDVGGESSRPGSDPVAADEELLRVIPVIEQIRMFTGVPISIDTTKAAVAEKALTAGADIVNDISALRFDDMMAPLCAERQCPVVLMHMLGDPKTMQDNPHYDDVIKEVALFFEERMAFAASKNIARDKIILDIGIGFGKRLEDNLMLLKHLAEFRRFDAPLLVGASRKAFIGSVTGAAVDKRIDGSLAAAALAILNGADIIRTHDVAQTKHAVQLAAAVREV